LSPRNVYNFEGIKQILLSKNKSTDIKEVENVGNNIMRNFAVSYSL
jgi:hypothetical protein